VEYTIIGSGSSGNSVLINNMLFDIGLPFKKIKPYLYQTDYIFISHVHTDHLKVSTYNQIRKLFPNIIMIGNLEVHEKARMDIVAHEGEPIRLNGTVVTPFLAPHDVTVYGWTWELDNKNYIFVTDTYSMQNAPNKKYDYLFVEANHDQHKVDAIMNHDRSIYGYSAVDGALRHLSTQQAKEFYYLHRRTKDSLWVQLHKSSRFY